jgi:hypothetical protein
LALGAKLIAVLMPDVSAQGPPALHVYNRSEKHPDSIWFSVQIDEFGQTFNHGMSVLPGENGGDERQRCDPSRMRLREARNIREHGRHEVSVSDSQMVEDLCKTVSHRQICFCCHPLTSSI